MTATRKAVLQELVAAGRLEIIHIEREETKQADTLADCLADIGAGLRTDSAGFWIADKPA